ncbi:MAG: hypothetical protein V3G42_08745 [Oscillospiraceae bacterium]
MIIFYKCSFRSSHGFRIGKYHPDTGELVYISEKSDEIINAIPKTIEYTLSNQLGKCFLLATDEHGKVFFGAYRLVEGNDDKYVNAVFYAPETPEKILNIYEYFCQHPPSAVQMMLDSIRRAEPHETQYRDIGFVVQPEILSQFLENMDSSKIDGILTIPEPNAIVAFITEDSYEDYQITLESGFSVNPKKMFLCEKYHPENETIEQYQLAKRAFFKPAVMIAPPVMVGGIAGLIVILILLLLK